VTSFSEYFLILIFLDLFITLFPFCSHCLEDLEVFKYLEVSSDFKGLTSIFAQSFCLFQLEVFSILSFRFPATQKIVLTSKTMQPFWIIPPEFF
jgi:hypothetical protein